MQELSTDDAPAAIGPYSQGIVDGDTVYVSGQGPIDPDGEVLVEGDTAEQAHRTLDNVAAVLSDAGASLDDVLKATVFLTDIGYYDAVNDAYAERVSEPFPARSAVEVADLPVEGMRVEVEVIAGLD
jgi:2-iminobutanoate/2-iminopropanoate deaminase